MPSARGAVVFLLLAAAVPLCAMAAEVATGRPLPAFEATDLSGHKRHPSDLVGRPTVLVVMANRDAADGEKAWDQQIQARYGLNGHVHRVTVIALDLPFFVPDSLVMDRARDHTPRAVWDDTWVGTNGDLQDALGLSSDSDQPYVFTMDESGRVTAAVHGAFSPESARVVFGALDPAR